MGKGEQHRAAILDAALAQASETGFESLTIGSLAQRTGLSKSGLFAHFGSREDLQVAAIEAAGARFTETVFLPALKHGADCRGCAPCSSAGSTGPRAAD
jgi:AcrR family transcriptional regulator